MQVEFRRTGERRYAIAIHRDALPTLTMNPAPGFDALMPHDLLHFIVEKELGLRKGIFGQLAAGGTAGTFHIAQSAASNNRVHARKRRSTKERGKKLMDEGQDDCAQSERGTYICMYEWLLHSSDPQLRARAAEMKHTADSILNVMPAAERRALNDKFQARMHIELETLSREWSSLEIGQSMTLKWSPRK